jgi:hypothetical protein
LFANFAPAKACISPTSIFYCRFQRCQKIRRGGYEASVGIAFRAFGAMASVALKLRLTVNNADPTVVSTDRYAAVIVDEAKRFYSSRASFG